MLIPTHMARDLAADTVSRRRGAATRRLGIRNPLTGIARARAARRPVVCATC